MAGLHDFSRGLTERRAIAALWGLLLAPVLAHGIWRPVLEAVGGDGGALALTLAAMAVALVVAVVDALRPRWRFAAAGAAAGAGALAAGGHFGAALAALAGVGGAAAVCLPILAAWVPDGLAGAARRYRGRTIALVLFGAVALVVTARLATFMGDPTRTHLAISHGLAPHFTHHACSTAYMYALHLAEAGVPDLYAPSVWPSLGGPQPAGYEPFEVDAYLYPPPFLLLPKIISYFGAFPAQRPIWFALDGLILAAGLWWVVRLLTPRSPRTATWAVLLMPLVWASTPVLITLQVGNAHFLVVALAVLGLVAMERGRPALGGALLAFATLGKISPGVIGIVLLVQRRWREAAWTAGFGVVWGLATVALFGWAPFEAFVHTLLPRLGSGEAFAFFAEDPGDVVVNVSAFGIPFKLQALGLTFDDVWATGQRFGQVANVATIGLAVLAGVRARAATTSPPVGLWLAVLTLAGMASPFAPAYVGFTGLWLLTIWAAEIRRPAHVALLVLGYLSLLSLPGVGPVSVAVTLVEQLAVFGLLAWFIVRRPRAVP